MGEKAMIKTIELRRSARYPHRIAFAGKHCEEIAKIIQNWPKRDRKWLGYDRVWEFEEKYLAEIRYHCRSLAISDNWLFLDRIANTSKEIEMAIGEHRTSVFRQHLTRALQVIPKFPKEFLRVVGWTEDSLLLQLRRRPDDPELYETFKTASLYAGHLGDFGDRVQKTPFFNWSQWIFEIPHSAEIIAALIAIEAEHLHLLEATAIEKLSDCIYCLDGAGMEWLAIPLDKIEVKSLLKDIDGVLSLDPQYPIPVRPYWNLIAIEGCWYIANPADGVMFDLLFRNLQRVLPQPYRWIGEGYGKATSLGEFFQSPVQFVQTSQCLDYFEKWCGSILQSPPVLRRTRHQFPRGLVAEDWLHPFELILEWHRDCPDAFVPRVLIEIAPEVMAKAIDDAIFRTCQETRQNAIEHNTDAVLGSNSNFSSDRAILGGIAGIRVAFEYAKNHPNREMELLFRCLEYGEEGRAMLEAIALTTEAGKLLQRQLLKRKSGRNQRFKSRDLDLFL